jgi:threonine/homoserine/homoserine lactone efflux protein
MKKPPSQAVSLTHDQIEAIRAGARAWRRGASQSITRPARLILWAFLALISNVKALTLYALVVPTVNADIAGLALYLSFGAVHIVMLLIWLTLVGCAVAVVPGMRSDRARRGLSFLGGAFMLALGIHTFVVAVR